MNLRKGAENLLNFLDAYYHSKYDSIVEDFISEMIKSENKEFMTIYDDYDRTSFVQYDIILMLFFSYCKNVVGSEKVIKYKSHEDLYCKEEFSEIQNILIPRAINVKFPLQQFDII
jgi:hypothetical protein